MKKIVAIMLALVMSLGVLAACDETPLPSGGNEQTQPTDTNVPCTLSVTCGNGGTYSVSPTSDYHVGDEVTLTLSPYSGYRAGEVKVNGKALVLNGNECTFTLEGDSAAEISFDPIPSHSVTVNCGVGGSYTLSPNRSTYTEGTEVTLRVTPFEYYVIHDVLLNGDAVMLGEDNSYTFTVEAATVIDLTFEDTRYKTVTVNCGAGGDYELSPEGPYLNGTEVTLTVTPEEGYRVGKVVVNGTEMTLDDGNSCTFTADRPTTVEISFVEKGSVFPSELLGEWDPYVDSGVYGEGITVGQDSIVFEGKECLVTETDGALSFTYTDDEGESTEYTPSYRLIREGMSLLSISYTDLSDGGTATAYYLKRDVDYFTYSFPTEFVAEWETTNNSNSVVSITETSLLVGTSRAIVMGYDETSKTFTLLAPGGEEYTLALRGARQLVRTRMVNGKESVTYYSKVMGLDPVLIPQYAGTYTSKDGQNILVVNADGTAKYTVDGGNFYDENVVFRPADKFGTMPNAFTMEYKTATKSLSESADFLTDVGLGLRVWIRKSDLEDGVELYAADYKEPTMKINVQIVGEGGSYTLSPSPLEGEEGYRAGVTVTITITANEGYVIDKIEHLSVLGQWIQSYFSNPDPKTQVITYTVTEKNIDIYKDFDGYGYRVTFRKESA